MMVDGVVDKSKFTDKRKSREKRILVSWILKIKLGVMDSWWWIRFVVITNFFLSFLSYFTKKKKFFFFLSQLSVNNIIKRKRLG